MALPNSMKRNCHLNRLRSSTWSLIKIKYHTCVEVNPNCSAITSRSAGVKYFWKLNRFSNSFNWYVVNAVLFFRFFLTCAFWPSIAENSVPDRWNAFLKVQNWTDIFNLPNTVITPIKRPPWLALIWSINNSFKDMVNDLASHNRIFDP